MKLIILCLPLFAITGTAVGAEILIAGFEYSPFSIVNNANLSGIGADILNHLIEDSGNIKKGTSVVSVKRMMLMAKEENIVFTTLTRTVDREVQVQWIGKISDDMNCFFTFKDRPINSVEDAKKLVRIGVNAGGLTEKFLVDNGFKNIEALSNNTLNFRKIAVSHIPAWHTSEIVGRYTAINANADPGNYVCNGNVHKTNYWIAASLKTDKSIVDSMRLKFSEMERSGEITRIINGYLK
ncbi:transporter substrate-binding domain-containing protein [Undibacterium jejuense]|uniref:Transporter substrate-binding domain-containing protein n=1 Tax=Undibacterium jejuense TaxID=1344949 RepID=A0A923KIV3_9BURK|nr:transporter substrate-binding domain-containing protein [Undibacterium jejuense]MBC3863322.1 transporter substrate-binding domain-containing protein [Undibacterium jejuense]